MPQAHPEGVRRPTLGPFIYELEAGMGNRFNSLVGRPHFYWRKKELRCSKLPRPSPRRSPGQKCCVKCCQVSQVDHLHKGEVDTADAEECDGAQSRSNQSRHCFRPLGVTHPGARKETSRGLRTSFSGQVPRTAPNCKEGTLQT